AKGQGRWRHAEGAVYLLRKSPRDQRADSVRLRLRLRLPEVRSNGGYRPPHAGLHPPGVEAMGGDGLVYRESTVEFSRPPLRFPAGTGAPHHPDVLLPERPCFRPVRWGGDDVD